MSSKGPDRRAAQRVHPAREREHHRVADHLHHLGHSAQRRSAEGREQRGELLSFYPTNTHESYFFSPPLTHHLPTIDLLPCTATLQHLVPGDLVTLTELNWTLPADMVLVTGAAIMVTARRHLIVHDACIVHSAICHLPFALCYLSWTTPSTTYHSTNYLSRQDEAGLTGESIPVQKTACANDALPLDTEGRDVRHRSALTPSLCSFLLCLSESFLAFPLPSSFLLSLLFFPLLFSLSPLSLLLYLFTSPLCFLLFLSSFLPSFFLSTIIV